MLSPRKIKFKKTRKISLNYTQKNTLILTRFKEGSIKIEALQFGRVTAKQLESSKASIHKAVKKTGNLELKVFPDVPVSKKPTAVRMGKGKGSFSFWACRVIPGTVIFEVSGANKKVSYLALESGAKKLPFQIKIVV